jgi:hypothetical protein
MPQLFPSGSDGGVYLMNGTPVGGSLIIEGNAKISDNEAVASGGGISTGSNSRITMSGSAEISGNKANIGGGVEVYGSTFTMNSGTISGNQATAGAGGGVYVYDVANSIFEMNSGTIYGSGAGVGTANTGGGAAVYVETNGNSTVSTTDYTIIR